MEPTAIVLLAISAAMHATWNWLVKKQHPSAAFFLLANAIGTLALLPVALCFSEALPLIPARVWALTALTGFFMAVYYAGLAGAYRSGDMSLAYPLARSSPILVLTVTALLLGEGKQIGWGCIAGVVLVFGGCMLLPMARFRDFRLRNYLNTCCAFALVAALGTTGYTIVDDRALKVLRALPGGVLNAYSAPLLYIVMQGLAAALWQTLYVACSRREREALRRDWAAARRMAVIVGVGIYLTYPLALAAMAFVRNVSYVAAFRQLSIPIGAVMAFVLLKERAPAPKLTGLLLLLTGLLLVALG